MKIQRWLKLYLVFTLIFFLAFPISSFFAETHQSLEEGLLAYWEMEEGQGLVVQDSTDNIKVLRHSL